MTREEGEGREEPKETGSGGRERGKGGRENSMSRRKGKDGVSGGGR